MRSDSSDSGRVSSPGQPRAHLGSVLANYQERLAEPVARATASSALATKVANAVAHTTAATFVPPASFIPPISVAHHAATIGVRASKASLLGEAASRALLEQRDKLAGLAKLAVPEPLDRAAAVRALALPPMVNWQKRTVEELKELGGAIETLIEVDRGILERLDAQDDVAARNDARQRRTNMIIVLLMVGTLLVAMAGVAVSLVRG